MLLAPKRLNVGAWFAVAAAGPVAMGAVAAAATSAGMAREAGLWAAALLAPPLALAFRSLEGRGDHPQPRPWNPERTLRAALTLSTVEAVAILLAVLAGAPFDGFAIACGLAASAAPLALAAPAALAAYAFPGLLETAGVTQPFEHPDARRWQRTVQRAEYERLQEMARQAEARRQVTVLDPRLRTEQEAGERQELVAIGLAGPAADGAPGAGADPDQIVHLAGGGAFGEIEAEPQVGQKARLEAHEDRGPDLGMDEGLAQGLEGQEGAGMGLALGQRAGHDGGRGGDAGQGQGIVEQRRRPGAKGPRAGRLKAGRAQLLADPGAIARLDPGAGLQDGLHPAGISPGHMSGPAAVVSGQQVDDGAALAVGPGGQNVGLVAEFHPIKLWAPAEEIQPPDGIEAAFRPIRLWVPPEVVDAEVDTATARMDEALGELRNLLHHYRAEVVEAPRTPRLRVAAG